MMPAPLQPTPPNLPPAAKLGSAGVRRGRVRRPGPLALVAADLDDAEVADREITSAVRDNPALKRCSRYAGARSSSISSI